MAITTINQRVNGKWKPVQVFADTETDLATIAANITQYRNATILVRNASGTGPKQFLVNTSDQIVPGPGNVPTCTLQTSAAQNVSVASGADVVIGSASAAVTLARVFRNPGADTLSPFSSLWSYSAGVLSGVPAGRARMVATAQVSDVRDIPWTLALQTRTPPGSWSDDQILFRGGISGIGSTPGSTINAPAEFEISTLTQEWRMVMRHSSLVTGTMSIDSMIVFVNSVAQNS